MQVLFLQEGPQVLALEVSSELGEAHDRIGCPFGGQAGSYMKQDLKTKKLVAVSEPHDKAPV